MYNVGKDALVWLKQAKAIHPKATLASCVSAEQACTLLTAACSQGKCDMETVENSISAVKQLQTVDSASAEATALLFQYRLWSIVPFPSVPLPWENSAALTSRPYSMSLDFVNGIPGLKAALQALQKHWYAPINALRKGKALSMETIHSHMEGILQFFVFIKLYYPQLIGGENVTLLSLFAFFDGELSSFFDSFRLARRCQYSTRAQSLRVQISVCTYLIAIEPSCSERLTHMHMFTETARNYKNQLNGLHPQKKNAEIRRENNDWMDMAVLTKMTLWQCNEFIIADTVSEFDRGCINHTGALTCFLTLLPPMRPKTSFNIDFYHESDVSPVGRDNCDQTVCSHSAREMQVDCSNRPRARLQRTALYRRRRQ